MNTTLDPVHLDRIAYLRGYVAAANHLLPALEAACRAALTDPLTGLPNRLATDQRLASIDTDVGWWLGLVDARGLKAVNDAYGHGAGDRLLQTVASVLVAVAEPGCWVARHGGDEFLFGTPEGGGPGQPERIARLIEAALLDGDGEHPEEAGPAVRIGWASTRDTSPIEALEAAGLALARAKASGLPRDGSTVHSVRYEPAPAAADAGSSESFAAGLRGDARIPVQVRRIGLDADRVTARRGSDG